MESISAEADTVLPAAFNFYSKSEALKIDKILNTPSHLFIKRLGLLPFHTPKMYCFLKSETAVLGYGPWLFPVCLWAMFSHFSLPRGGMEVIKVMF